MELQLPQLRRRAQGHDSRAAAHAVVDRRLGRRRRLGAVQRLARPARADQGLPGTAARRAPSATPASAPSCWWTAQIDHTTGLLMLREGKPLEIWCTDMVREDLTTGNPLFNILGHYCGVNWHALPIERGQRLRCRRHRATCASPRAAQEQGAALLAASRQPARGRQHRHAHHRPRSGKQLFYAPGLGEIEPHSQPFLDAGRLPDGGRHLLDRRRDDPPGHLEQARARHRPPAAVRARAA